MDRLVVYLLVLFVSFNVGASDLDEETLPSQIWVDEIESNNVVRFLISTNFRPSQEKYEVVSSCHDQKRQVAVLGADKIEMRAEFFSNGDTRQYVVSRQGEVVALVKVKREACESRRLCEHARLQLTDPSDRILLDIAASENEPHQIVARDNLSQITLRSVRADGKWYFRTVNMDHDIAPLLFAAARLDYYSCLPREEPKGIWGHSLVRAALMGTVFAITTSLYYFKYYR